MLPVEGVTLTETSVALLVNGEPRTCRIDLLAELVDVEHRVGVAGQDAGGSFAGSMSIELQ